MTDIVHESLKKMAVGTSIVLIGTVVSMFFEFLSRILIIRSTSTAEYGIFALALVILNIAVIIATLGLQNGATRQIAYYRGRNDLSRVYSSVVSSLELTAVAGWPYIHGRGCVLAFPALWTPGYTNPQGWLPLPGRAGVSIGTDRVRSVKMEEPPVQ